MFLFDSRSRNPEAVQLLNPAITLPAETSSRYDRIGENINERIRL
jgi:hypothetical protein